MALYHSAKGSVNYTVVGSPTITNGVVSGFSGSDYVSVQTALNWNDNIEWVVKIKTPSSFASLNQIAFMPPMYLYIRKEGTTGILSLMYISGSDTKYLNSVSALQTDTVYFIKFVKDATSFSLYLSTDGVNYTLENTRTDYLPTTSSYVSYGVSDSSSYTAWPGSIDLKETYITVNGQPWFGVCPVEVKHINYGTPVGYTVVGSPTITNGVVSGFSVNDYLASTANLPANAWKDIEIGVKFTTPAEVGDYQYVLRTQFHTGTQGGLGIYSSSKFGWYLGRKSPYSSSTDNINVSSNITAIANKTYWIKGVIQNNKAELFYSEDGQTYSNIGEKDITGFDFGSDANLIGIGGIIPNTSSSFGLFGGSIDLNETYIKVNGKLWFFRPSTNYLVKDDKLVFADSGLYLSGPKTYTVNGNPVIVDGVVSNFNVSNYFSSQETVDMSQSAWEVHTKFTTPATYPISTTNNRSVGIIGQNALWNGLGLEPVGVTHAGKAFVYIMQSNSTVVTALRTTNSLQASTTYFAKYGWNGNTTYYLSISTDGQNWDTYTGSFLAPLSQSKYLRIGNIGYYDIVFNGSIDLKETYFKIGNTLYYGKNYASKNIAPVPSGYTYGNTTTSAIGYVDMRTQGFTAAPSGATLGRDE